ncbi:hypothetical protein MKEN_00953400 [Mycena kentingensis (nom. inval.)]|nr:hypothetical protein MKEN_00953400 [Mycena kentingensis (nom. inval.)]
MSLATSIHAYALATPPRARPTPEEERSTRSPSPPSNDRDATYYLETGDAALTLDGVRFKVHKAIFSRDPDSRLRDGEPFVGSADDFRAFCWVMYAPPHEICMQTRPDPGYANVPRLLRVARVAERHGLRGLKGWVLEVVFGLCLPVGGYLESPVCTRTPETICTVFELAKVEGRMDVVQRVLDVMDIEAVAEAGERREDESDGEWVDFEAIMDGPPGMHEDE